MVTATSTTRSPSNTISKVLKLVSSVFAWTITEPLVTGPALLTLLYGPEAFRASLIERIPSIVRTAFLTVLKTLFTYGLLRRLNTSLNALSLRHYRPFEASGTPWTFYSPASSEIILITGGCSGFGLLMTHLFSRLTPTTKLIILDISPPHPSFTTFPNTHYYQCDLTSTTQISAVSATLTKAHGCPTVLINNAGTGAPSSILSLPASDLQRTFAVNFFAHYALLQQFLPSMLDARKGHIVTLASMSSFISLPNMIDYCSSKSAVMALHEGLDSELKHLYANGECIRTTILHPTWSPTGLTKDSIEVLRRQGQHIVKAEDVAEVVVKQVLSGRSGGRICMPGGMGALVATLRGWPGWAQELVRGIASKATVGAVQGQS